MALSEDLISQFVKVTNDDESKSKETTVYATVRDPIDGVTYVKLDGADEDILTPVDSTVDVKPGDRVTVLIKNHTATIMGSTTAQAARNETVVELSGQLEDVVANSVTTGYLEAKYATIENLEANYATIENLQADRAEIDELVAKKADIETLEADKAEITELIAKKADIEHLHADYAKVETLEADYATIDYLDGKMASIDTAYVKKAEIESLNSTYANIDFSNIGEAAIKKIYADTGLIKNITVGDQTITGELVGVTISGDLIKANSIYADKLVVKGEDGVYYKLNIEAGATTSEKVTEEDLQNGLHGSAIIAETITADKIHVTDLSAFGAKIGGFTIDDNAIYAHVKDSAGNNVRGFYVDNDGQMTLGDAFNYIKYYYDEESDTYKLKIAAESLTFGVSGNTVEQVVQGAVDEAVKDIDVNVEVGGRNLVLNSATEVTVSNETLKTAYSLSQYGLDKFNGVYGQSVALSFDAVATADTTVSVYTRNSGTNTINDPSTNAVPSFDVTTTKKRYSVTSTTKNAATKSIALQHAGSGITVTISNIKLEFGTVATDWTPAPEDVDSAISNAQTTANNANTAAGNAQSTANAANTAAGNAQNTANAANTAASNAQNTANTARQEASDAATKATNYIHADSTGLVVGNKPSDTANLKGNVRIDTDSVDIRNGDTMLATFTKDEIQLGITSQTTSSTPVTTTVWYKVNGPTWYKCRESDDSNILKRQYSATSTVIYPTTMPTRKYRTNGEAFVTNDGLNAPVYDYGSTVCCPNSSTVTYTATTTKVTPSSTPSSFGTNATNGKSVYYYGSGSSIVYCWKEETTTTTTTTTGGEPAATFSKDKIELGKNSKESIIALCGNSGTIVVKDSGSSEIIPDSLFIEAEAVTVGSVQNPTNSQWSGYTTYTPQGTSNMSYGDMFTKRSSTALARVRTHINNTETLISMHTEYKDSIWYQNGIKIHSDTGITAYTGNAEITNSGPIRPWNVKLWDTSQGTQSGAWMDQTQTVYLREGVSDQPNGIVLVFWDSDLGIKTNSFSHVFFIPKAVIEDYDGTFPFYASWVNSSQAGTFGFKCLYISNTSITGYALTSAPSQCDESARLMHIYGV